MIYLLAKDDKMQASAPKESQTFCKRKFKLKRDISILLRSAAPRLDESGLSNAPIHLSGIFENSKPLRCPSGRLMLSELETDKRVLIRAYAICFFGEWKRDVIIGFTKCAYLIGSARFLGTKIVAGNAYNLQFISKLFLQLLQLRILWCKAALRCHIYNQYFFAAIVFERKRQTAKGLNGD